MSKPKEVTRAELEGRLWELLNAPDGSTQARLESARLLHESIKAREDAQRERGEWDGAQVGGDLVMREHEKANREGNE